MATIYETLGQHIRTLRKERQLSQEVLAVKAHSDWTSVSEIESGLRNPSLKTLHKLARALCVPVADLFR